MDQGSRTAIHFHFSCDGATVEMTASVTVALGIVTVGDKRNKNFPEDYAEEKGWIKGGPSGGMFWNENSLQWNAGFAQF